MSRDRSVLSRLRALLAALDRRRPHVDRADEHHILPSAGAPDAAVVKTQAQGQIAQLEALPEDDFVVFVRILASPAVVSDEDGRS